MYISIGIICKILHYIRKQSKTKRQILKLEKQGKHNEIQEIIQPVIQDFGKYCFELTKSTVEVKGLENVPQNKAVIYIANHQGMMDMPLIFGYIPAPKGFIAKIESKKIPVISTWMKYINCVYMDRKNIKKSVQAIYDGIENVKSGNSMAIFPEGTRSRGRPVKPFKPGSFKLAFASGADIIPLSIDGTYHILEEKGKIQPAHVTLTIHPAVKTEGTNKDQQAQIVKQVQATIESALTQNSFKDPIDSKKEN